jgi:hypothetical protein
MRAVTTALLVLIAVALQLWAQEPQEPTPREPAPSSQQQREPAPSSQQQNGAEPGPPSESVSASPSTPVTETTQYPLDKFQDFSAVQNGGPLPGMDVDRYIYRFGKLMRMQTDDTLPSYYVTELDTQRSHFVSSRACLRMNAPYTRSFPFGLSGPGFKYDLIPIGEEIVDGHRCRIEDIMIHNPKNPVIMHFRLYEADDLQGFPIKIENRRKGAYAWVIHYKDVRLEPQDPSLFIFPEKCETMAGFKKAGPDAKSRNTHPMRHP